MLVGKTQPSISKAEIFNSHSEAEVLSSVFPDIKSLPCLINSPLRQDNHPSFSIYVNGSGSIKFVDFATGDRGGLLDLLCKYWNCTFTQCLIRLKDSFVSNASVGIHNTRTSSKRFKKVESRIEVKVRPWQDYDIDYWQSYGCNISLLKYCEVYPISHKIIYKDKRKYTFAAPRYSYVFVEHKEGRTTKKIYSPYATKFKWITDNDHSVIGLWDKVPKSGDRLCICSSLKDAVCLWSNLGIPCLYIQGEAYHMSKTAIKVLKKRYRKIYISLDTDKWGKADAERLSVETGFTNIVPDLGECKDFSDSYKKYGKAWFIDHVKPCFA